MTTFHDITLNTDDIAGARHDVVRLTLVDPKGRKGHLTLQLGRNPNQQVVAKLIHGRKNTDVVKSITLSTWIIP